jgi:hypothetical protein
MHCGAMVSSMPVDDHLVLCQTEQYSSATSCRVM